MEKTNLADTTANIDIIRTKLHRPLLTEDLIPRTQLLERLEHRRQRPLTLVSASAGYGKSTLVSHWLEISAYSGVWVSLDEDDNDLRLFVIYVIAAIHTLFPEAGQQTQAILNAPEFPPGNVLARILLNDLVQIEAPFLLVLDDYHRIHDPPVHDLLKVLLQHPPPSLHLVLVTRQDPPLPLPSFRGLGQVTEISAQDLCFSTGETAIFLHKLLEMPIDDRAAELLTQKTEGWVTGLRLATLFAQTHKDIERMLSGLPEEHNVIEYLLAEVLSQQPPAIQHSLLATSLLNRFCAPLCETLCQTVERAAGDPDGKAFVAWVERTNLFVIPLDTRHHWFRYHHLFQTLLQHRLHRLYSPDDITALHIRASAWFAEHGLIEEALHHAVAIDDFAAVGRLICRHRHQVAGQGQWHRIIRWLALLPTHVVEGDPELLLLNAWSCQTSGRLAEMADTLDRVEVILGDAQPDNGVQERFHGEYSSLRSFQHYDAGNGQLALTCAEQAIHRLPPECVGERAYAILMLAISLQMTGDLQRAYDVIHSALEQTHDNAVYQGRLLMSLGFMQWMAADLVGLSQTSAATLKVGTDHELPDTTTRDRYLQGIAHYHSNRLTAAEEALALVVSTPSRASGIIYFRSTLALSLVRQAQGRPEQARDMVTSLIRHLLETGNSTSLALAQAFQAELALRQGRLAEAVQWVETYTTRRLSAGYSLFSPKLTVAKVLLSQGTATTLKQADDLLAGLHEFFTSTHNTRFLIEVLALQAMLYDIRGDEAAALKSTDESIRLAEPGGFIRLFVDLGPGMAKLLKRLSTQTISMGYLGRLLKAFTYEELGMMPEASAHDALLTKREIEILTLLAQRVSNPEIAEMLFIAPGTVKFHTLRIYKKLEVHSRREAVAKAGELRLLSRD